MKSSQFMFFATFSDVKQPLEEIERVIEVKYMRAGLFDTKDIPCYPSIFDAPNPGIAASGDWNRVDNYLVIKRSQSVNIREVPQKAGDLKFAVDQLINLKSIALKLGGIYPGAANVIVGGRISTVSENSDSQDLYKLVTTRFRKDFTRVGAFYVGKSALERLKEGWRLVTNEKSPREYDLTLNG